MAAGGTGFVKVNIPKPKVDLKATTSSATRSTAYSTSGNTRTSVFNTPTMTRPVATHASNSYSNRPTATNVNRQLGGGSAAYNVMGQKGINPWAPNNGITGFGQQLNANRTPAFIYDNYDYGLQPYQDKEMSTMDWIMAGSMMLGQALKGAADITAAIKDIKNSGTDSSSTNSLQEKYKGSFTSIANRLNGKKSLNDIQTVMDSALIEDKYAKFEENTKNIGTQTQDDIKGKITSDDQSLLTAANTKMPDDSLLSTEFKEAFDIEDLQTYDGAIKRIDEAHTNATTYLDNLGTTISALNTYRNSLDPKADNYSEQTSKIDALIAKLKGDVTREVNEHRDQLVQQRLDLLALQELMIKAHDKQYEIAQEINADYEKYKQQMDALLEEISQLERKSPQDTGKINKKKEKFNGFVKKMNTDVKAKIVGNGFDYSNNEIKDSKGNTISLPSVDQRYTTEFPISTPAKT